MANELSRAFEIELSHSEIAVTIRAKHGKPADWRADVLPALSYLRKKFGDEELAELLQNLLESRINQLLQNSGEEVAGGIDVQGLWNTWDRNVRFRYRVTFDVYPKFSVQGLDTLRLLEIRPVIIDDATLDTFIEQWRRGHSAWRKVDRAAQDGDRVIVDFIGTITGEPFHGSRGTAATVELGACAALPEFETAVRGRRAGEKALFAVHFADEYRSVPLAGKTADFEMDILEVRELNLIPLDDAFAQRCGAPDMANLRVSMAITLQQQHRDFDRRDISNNLLGQLSTANPILLPDALVYQQLEGIRAEIAQQKGLKVEDVAIEEDMIINARRRTQMSIVVRELVNAEKIAVDPADLAERHSAMAAKSDNPEFVLGNLMIREQIRAELLQERVINWLIARAKQNADTIPSHREPAMNPFHRHHHHPSSDAPPFAGIITDAFLHVRYERHPHHHGVLSMSSAKLAGTTPIARLDGTPLALAEIASLDFFDDVGDGNGPKLIGSLPTPGATFEFVTSGVLSVGNHNFTFVVNDTTGHKSAPSNTAQLAVPATLAAPAAGTDLTATLIPDAPAPAAAAAETSATQTGAAG